MSAASIDSTGVDAARHFLVANARILELRRFEHLFQEGDPGPIREAVAAYRNSDGGFGQALEPDCRCPHSHPMAIDFALRTLHEADVWDADLADAACQWLVDHAPPEGGACFPGPYASGWGHAPWYDPQDGDLASPISTGQIVGTLHARGVTHPWLTRATELMWSLIESPTTTDAFEIRPLFFFLEHVPDRARAREAILTLGRYAMDNGLVTLDPHATGITHTPLDYAPFPDSPIRALFDADLIDGHLDHLAAAQLPDGGWTFTFPVWSPIAEREWRGHFTVEALRILRANGRLCN